MKLFVVPAPLINTSFLIDLCENMVFSPKPTLTIRGPQGSGGGGSLQISSDRDDQMGAKVKTPKKSLDENLTPKKSLANFPSHKNF